MPRVQSSWYPWRVLWNVLWVVGWIAGLWGAGLYVRAGNFALALLLLLCPLAYFGAGQEFPPSQLLLDSALTLLHPSRKWLTRCPFAALCWDTTCSFRSSAHSSSPSP